MVLDILCSLGSYPPIVLGYVLCEGKILLSFCIDECLCIVLDNIPMTQLVYRCSLYINLSTLAYFLTLLLMYYHLI